MFMIVTAIIACCSAADVQGVLPAGFENKVPFVVALIELEEQPGLRIIANVQGCAPDELRIGTPVEVVFEDVTSEVTLPQFQVRSERPSTSSG